MDEINQIFNLPSMERYFILRGYFNDGKMSIVKAVAKKIAEDRRSKQGNWGTAIKFVNLMSEPQLTFSAKQEKHYYLNLNPVEGFKCQYVRHRLNKSKGGESAISWIIIINPDLNLVYQKMFGEVSYSEVKDIFS